MPGEGTTQMALMSALTAGECLTVEQITSRTEIDRRSVARAAGKLVTRGYAERVEIGCFRLTDDGRAAMAAGVVIRSGPKGPDTCTARRPQVSTLRQRAWHAMRMGEAFTIGDLVTAATTGAERDPTSSLQRYVKALARAGYLTELPKRAVGIRPGSNGFKRWRLVDDTGEIAPVLRVTAREVYDHNRREVRPCK